MPEKYHISVKTVPPRIKPIGKYATIEFREDCAGSCRACVKKNCVYDVFKENYLHMSVMDEPEYLYHCNSCFRCVQECTKGIFSRVINPEYRALGDDHWTPNIIHRTWYQAHTGKIPVSGAGYRGPFSGQGFDSMWTDMSEIVRPTRDGIHGREYINTGIELSRRPARLSFNEDMELVGDLPPILEVPLPILFRQPNFGILSDAVLLSMAKAARTIGTFLLISPDRITDKFAPFLKNLMPRLHKESYAKHADLIKNCRMIDIAYEPGIENEFEKLRGMRDGLFISVSAPLNRESPKIAYDMTASGVDTIHFQAGDNGKEIGSDNPRHIKDAIRDVHLHLIDKSVRHQTNLLFSGGIAMAEHVAKSIICGADGVVVDNTLLIAMECRLCNPCLDSSACPAKLDEMGVPYGCDRIVNLMGAWRNQLLEMMGAMGLREARRLRGEVGRSMLFEDLEKECFSPIFGERKV